MNEYLIVLTTLPDDESCKDLARLLVKRKLAACVNILPPMTSIYEWKGELEQGTEQLLLIKTRRERYAELENVIRDSHPYEIPEIIAVPVEHGLADYLKWINDETAA